MVTPPEQFPKKEHPSTYVVQDRSNQEEMLRLTTQDHMYNTAMGGVLPEQDDPTRFERVLDVGCGTGVWLIETARQYPTIAQLIGVDVSERMINYARTLAEEAQLTDRVSFQTGDALRMLDFPDQFFSLVNQRFGASFLRKWDWPKLLREYQRVCHPDGVIRITEGAVTPETNSPALTRLMELFRQAMTQAGHLFTPGNNGVIDHLAEQMQKYGIEDVQTKSYTLALHGNPQTRQAYAENVQRGFRTLAPFIRKWVKFSDDYEALYKQMLYETQQPDLEIRQTILTAWGRPLQKQSVY